MLHRLAKLQLAELSLKSHHSGAVWKDPKYVWVNYREMCGYSFKSRSHAFFSLVFFSPDYSQTCRSMDFHVRAGAGMCSSRAVIAQQVEIVAMTLRLKQGGKWNYEVIGRVKKVTPLTRWCHWEQVHSWPPIYATELQWWRLTAEACAGSSHRCSLSQCWKIEETFSSGVQRRAQ